MGSLCSLSAVECFYFLDTFLSILPKTEPFSFFFNLKNKKQGKMNTVVFFIFCFHSYCFSVGMRTFTAVLVGPVVWNAMVTEYLED